MNGPDDMPILMSAPNANAPTLARVELGEDTITLELHYPTGEVGILTFGFRGKRRLYTLVETGYTMDAAPFGEMFCFVAEHMSGKRYRWYVHTENPTETFVQINAHVEAKAPLKHEAAALYPDEADEIATAPSPTLTLPSPTRPSQIENEHKSADKTDPKPEAAVIPYVVQQAAFYLSR